MNAKLNFSKSRMIQVTNSVPRNSKHVHGIKNILLTTTKPTKYIVTLKPLSRGNVTKEKASSEQHTQKVIINPDDVLKGKSMFDTKIIFKTKLGKIEEQSEKSDTSVESKNYDLKLAQSLTNIYRLSGGWGVGEETKKSNKTEDNTYSTNGNEQKTNEVAENVPNSEDNVFMKVDNNKFVNMQMENSPEKKKVEELPLEAVKDEPKQSNTKDEMQIFSNNGNTFNHGKQSITSSFIANVIDDAFPNYIKPTFSDSSSNYEQEDKISNSRTSSDTQSLLADIDLKEVKDKDFFHLFPAEKETCERIECLEKQVNRLYLDLDDLQRELLPPDDLAKLNLISKQFNEINSLITELKISCLSLQNAELHMNNKMNRASDNYDKTFLNTRRYDEFGHKPLKICSCHCVEDFTNHAPISPRPSKPKFRNYVNHLKISQSPFRRHCRNFKDFSRKQNFKQNPLESSLQQPEQQTLLEQNIDISNSPATIIKEPLNKYASGRSSKQLSKTNHPSYGEEIKKAVSPLTTNNLTKEIRKIIGNINSENIALTVFLESNNLYHINISVFHTGQCLGCIYTNEAAFQEAKVKTFFEKFLMFYVLNADNTVEERSRMLGHSFEFVT